jgi:hypothetical protein
MQESANGRITFLAGPDIKQDLISKVVNTKRLGGVVQVIECLPSKSKSLSSIPNIAKKKTRTPKFLNLINTLAK